MTNRTDAIKLAIEALQSSQDYVDAAANAQFLAGWGEQMDKAAAAIKALAALQAREGEAVIGTKTWMENGVMMMQDLTASDIYAAPQPAQCQTCWKHGDEPKRGCAWCDKQPAQPIEPAQPEQGPPT